MKRKVVAEVVDEVSNNKMNKKNKHLGSKVNPPVDNQKQQTLTQLDFVNLGYIIGDECQVTTDNQSYNIGEVLDENNKQAGFSVARLPGQQNWYVLPYPYSKYAPK